MAGRVKPSTPLDETGARLMSDADYWFEKAQELTNKYLHLAFTFGIYQRPHTLDLLDHLTGWSCPWATHIARNPDGSPRSWANTRYFVLHG